MSKPLFPLLGAIVFSALAACGDRWDMDIRDGTYSVEVDHLSPNRAFHQQQPDLPDPTTNCTVPAADRFALQIRALDEAGEPNDDIPDYALTFLLDGEPAGKELCGYKVCEGHGLVNPLRHPDACGISSLDMHSCRGRAVDDRGPNSGGLGNWREGLGGSFSERYAPDATAAVLSPVDVLCPNVKWYFTLTEDAR